VLLSDAFDCPQVKNWFRLG